MPQGVVTAAPGFLFRLLPAVLAGALTCSAASAAEFIPDPRLKALRVADAEIYTYAHVVYLGERQNARLVRAFLSVLPPLLSEEGRRALKATAA